MLINSTTIKGNSIITNVTYTLNDGSTVTIDVQTVNPQSPSDVITDLANMAVEQEKEHDASLNNIKSQIDSQSGQAVQATPIGGGVMTLTAIAQPISVQPVSPSGPVPAV